MNGFGMQILIVWIVKIQIFLLNKVKLLPHGFFHGQLTFDVSICDMASASPSESGVKWPDWLSTVCMEAEVHQICHNVLVV
jgi:hypothetical protein